MKAIIILLFLLCETTVSQTKTDLTVPRGDARTLQFTLNDNVTADSLKFVVTMFYQATQNISTNAIILKRNRHAFLGSDEQIFTIDSLNGIVRVYLSSDETALLSEPQYFYTLRLNDTTKTYGTIRPLPTLMPKKRVLTEDDLVNDTTGQMNDPRMSNIEADVATRVPSTRSVAAGTGLSGGGDLSADRTLNLANTTVTPGSYTVATVTVDQQGRITSAASGRDTTGQVNDPRMSNIETDVATRVPSIRSVTAGTGMTGGGDLSADRTLTLANTAVTPGSYTVATFTVDQQGRITSAASGRDTTGQVNDPRMSNIETDVATRVPSTRSVAAGTGLSGGGDLSADRTLSLANTAVTAGSYTTANITVDQQGRITAAASGSADLGDSLRMSKGVFADTLLVSDASYQIVDSLRVEWLGVDYLLSTQGHYIGGVQKHRRIRLRFASFPSSVRSFYLVTDSANGWSFNSFEYTMRVVNDNTAFNGISQGIIAGDYNGGAPVHPLSVKWAVVNYANAGNNRRLYFEPQGANGAPNGQGSPTANQIALRVSTINNFVPPFYGDLIIDIQGPLSASDASWYVKFINGY